MRKIIPLIFSGVAAVSFSTLVFAQSSASSDKAVAADNDKDPRTGVLNQGRAVGTAGGQPDSSQAQGRSPVVSPHPSTLPGDGSAASAGASTAERGASEGTSNAPYNASSRRAIRADEDNDPRTGVLNQGRAVGTGGGQPDSSQAQGRSPVVSPHPSTVDSATAGSGASTAPAAGASTSGAATGGAATSGSSTSADEETRRNTSRGAIAPGSDVRPGGVGSSTSGAGSSGAGAAGAGAGGAGGAGAGGAGAGGGAGGASQ
jgi:hypothetical protein